MEDWDNGRYMDWADQERLIQQDLDDLEKKRRKKRAENYREEENRDE